jgi:hypothetical protein
MKTKLTRVEKKLLYLINELYELTEQEQQKFLDIVSEFNEEEQIQIAYVLYEKLQKERSILKTLLTKLKLISSKVDEHKEKMNAEKILLDL